MRRGPLVRKTFHNVLPEHIDRSFRADLARLIDEQTVEEGGFKWSYLKEQCFSKYCDSTTTPPDVRRMAAITKWLTTEERNRTTSQRLMMFDHHHDFGWCTYGDLLRKMRLLVSRILGPIPVDILDYGCHTNGASTRVRRSVTAAIEKSSGEAHCTKEALQHWRAWSVNTLMEHQTVVIVPGSVLFTVPKTTDIDRVACKEPEINMLFQRSVGNYIRRRLRRFGVDLNDQTRNQKLAAISWKQGLATIDLSSASDSISEQLVIELLPFDWWSLLDDLRVKETSIDGVSHSLAMFSSMGNGFTFELESLLFYAITRAVCWLSGVKGTVSVYGDDIIAPSRIVPRLKRVFDLLGFKLNMKKTNFRGPFRESCGVHYFRGVDVSPFFVRGPLTRITDLIRVLNQLLEWDGRGWSGFTSEAVQLFHCKWAKHVPQVLWGGQDIEASSALVTGHSPRKVVATKLRRSGFEHTAGYLTWHLQRRITDLPVSIDPSVEVAYVLRDTPRWAVRTTWDPNLYFGVPDGGAT